jgi:lantibiotic modifying enzyme
MAIATTFKWAKASVPGLENFCFVTDNQGMPIFLCADQVFGDEHYRELAERVGHHGLDAYDDMGIPWPCGVQGGGETPGLMLGLAGIGHFYLRLFDSDKVPTILWPLQLAKPNADRISAMFAPMY